MQSIINILIFLSNLSSFPTHYHQPYLSHPYSSMFQSEPNPNSKYNPNLKNHESLIFRAEIKTLHQPQFLKQTNKQTVKQSSANNHSFIPFSYLPSHRGTNTNTNTNTNNVMLYYATSRASASSRNCSSLILCIVPSFSSL